MESKRVVIDRYGKVCSIGDIVMYNDQEYEIVHISGLLVTLHDKETDDYFNVLSYVVEKVPDNKKEIICDMKGGE